MYLKDGKKLDENLPITLPDGSHCSPQAWMARAAELGIEYRDDPLPPDPDLFIITGRGEDGSYITQTRDPADVVQIHNDAIWAQIHALELKELAPRMVRDLAKESATNSAAKIGMTLDQVYAIAVAQGDAAPEAAKGYKKFKDFDDSIVALKRQLR